MAVDREPINNKTSRLKLSILSLKAQTRICYRASPKRLRLCQMFSIFITRLQQGVLLLTCWKHSHWRHIFLASQEESSCLVRHQGKPWCEFHHTLIHNHQSQLRDGKISFYRVSTAGSLQETQLMPTKTKHLNEDSKIRHITQGHSNPEWEQTSGFKHF